MEAIMDEDRKTPEKTDNKPEAPKTEERPGKVSHIHLTSDDIFRGLLARLESKDKSGRGR